MFPRFTRLLTGLLAAALLVPAAAIAVPPQEVDENGNSTNDTTIEVENPDGPGDTHDPQEDPCVALSEGFGDFFANQLELELNTDGLLNSSESASSMTPFNRAELWQTYGLSDLVQVARSEIGWQQVFYALNAPDISLDLFGTPAGSPGRVAGYSAQGCSGQPTTFGELADVLRVIGSDMDISDVSVTSFLMRTDDRTLSFDAADTSTYLNAINPALSSEPHAHYGC